MRPTPLAAAALAAALAAPAGPARAGSIWEEATRDPEAQRVRDEYARAMSDGDEAAALAASESANTVRRKKYVLAAALAYELATTIDPDAAEPHWRAANVLYGFFLDCDGGPLCVGDAVDPRLYRRVIDHWDAFEAKAPLDPRVDNLLFDRAILRTKLATDADLEAAIRDYEALLDRAPVLVDVGLTLGNLAESYMMVGRLDDAIATYQAALRAINETSIFYGLAVAYDRDGQGAKAKEIIAALGPKPFEEWRKGVDSGRTFYVPEGEVFYYYALAAEALGHATVAAQHWRRYLDSGAHPEFQPRAQAHLDALTAARATGRGSAR